MNIDNKQILSDIRSETDELSRLLDGLYVELISGKPSFIDISRLKNAHLPLIRRIKNTIRRVSASKPTKPSMREAIRLLYIKNNSKAIDMLVELSSSGNKVATLKLGKIYLNGIKNRFGKIEYKKPREALRHLTISQTDGFKEAGYLIGTLYYNHGQVDIAKTVFFINHRNGCIRSSTELIVIIQEELNTKRCTPKQSLILKQQILNIRSDIKS